MVRVQKLDPSLQGPQDLLRALKQKGMSYGSIAKNLEFDKKALYYWSHSGDYPPFFVWHLVGLYEDLVKNKAPVLTASGAKRRAPPADRASELLSQIHTRFPTFAPYIQRREHLIDLFRPAMYPTIRLPGLPSLFNDWANSSAPVSITRLNPLVEGMQKFSSKDRKKLLDQYLVWRNLLGPNYNPELSMHQNLVQHAETALTQFQADPDFGPEHRPRDLIEKLITPFGSSSAKNITDKELVDALNIKSTGTYYEWRRGGEPVPDLITYWLWEAYRAIKVRDARRLQEITGWSPERVAEIVANASSSG
jgi:hypothetical protein